MAQYSDLDPFNLGTTSIRYAEIPSEESLMQVVKAGWGIGSTKILGLSTGIEKNSNNFRIETNNGFYLLKNSFINNVKSQELINRCVDYLRGEGIKVPQVFPTIENKSFYLNEKGIFCAYQFLDGENFDGSQKELVDVAREIGRLHHVLDKIPYKNELIDINGMMVQHNRELLKKVIQTVKKHDGQTEFDSYALSILDEVDERSRAVSSKSISDLPLQIVHYDLHPHNVLFNSSSELIALLDFDPLRYSQRARDVAFGMHWFARTCGSKTERRNDIGVDVRTRHKLFLDTYLNENKLKDEEIGALSLVLQDESLRGIICCLSNHYLKNDTTWSFDLPKDVTILREAELISF